MVNPKKRSKRIIKGILVIAFLFLLSVVFYHDTKAPTLPEPLMIPTSTVEMEKNDIVAEESNTNLLLTSTTLAVLIDTPLPSTTPLATPTSTRPTICNGPPDMILLAVGIDRRLDAYNYGMADVIRLVRVDFLTGDVTVLTLPRDLWVQIPGLEQSGIKEGKLTQVYYFGSEYFGAYHDPDYGPGLMITTLQANYDLAIDRYITVNMQSLERIIDTIGGVDIYLPYDVDGKSTDPDDLFYLGFFPAGLHHFTGESAVRFARIRMMDNDYYRTTRQSLILKGMWKKVLSPEILPKLPELVSLLSGTVRMNLQIEDIRSLVCLAPLLDEATPTFVNIPLEMLHEGRIYDTRFKNLVYAYQVDVNDFTVLLQDFQEGFWPVKEP